MSDQPKHTPGPWQAGPNPRGSFSNSFVVRPRGEFPHGLWIADCGSGDEESQANAELIAAAPEMADALQSIIDWADFALARPNEFNSHGVRNLDGPAFDKAREVLAAALGITS